MSIFYSTFSSYFNVDQFNLVNFQLNSMTYKNDVLNCSFLASKRSLAVHFELTITSKKHIIINHDTFIGCSNKKIYIIELITLGNNQFILQNLYRNVNPKNV